MSEDKVIIFDTTLRDGEQSAGIGLTTQEKIEIAKQRDEWQAGVVEGLHGGCVALGEGAGKEDV